jgi:hypothetical protein
MVYGDLVVVFSTVNNKEGVEVLCLFWFRVGVG